MEIDEKFKAVEKLVESYARPPPCGPYESRCARAPFRLVSADFTAWYTVRSIITFKTSIYVVMKSCSIHALVLPEASNRELVDKFGERPVECQKTDERIRGDKLRRQARKKSETASV